MSRHQLLEFLEEAGNSAFFEIHENTLTNKKGRNFLAKVGMSLEKSGDALLGKIDFEQLQVVGRSDGLAL